MTSSNWVRCGSAKSIQQDVGQGQGQGVRNVVSNPETNLVLLSATRFTNQETNDESQQGIVRARGVCARASLRKEYPKQILRVTVQYQALGSLPHCYLELFHRVTDSPIQT